MFEEIKIIKEIMEVKKMLVEQQKMMNMLFPEKVDISFISAKTGVSRQSIRKNLLKNFEPEVDFWKENARIYMSRETAITILSRRSM
jgi:hypothetical protein